MRIINRLGTTPRERGSATGQTCPDVFRLNDSNYLVIGRMPLVAPDRLFEMLDEHDASIGPNEYAVIVPADCMVPAAREIARQFENFPAVPGGSEEKTT